MKEGFDRRLTPARADLAASHLKGHVEAARFVDGVVMQVKEGVVDVKREPRPDASLDTQTLYGECVTVYDEEEGWAWTLRKAEIEYLRPARVDDLIEVRTAAVSLTGVRMVADQRIYCGDRLLTRGSVEACIIALSGKPRRIPAEMREKLAPLVSETNT